MMIHAIDTLSLPSQAAASTAIVASADAGAYARPATNDTDWRVAQLPGTDGLCFVRRGSGDWKGVITVCEGRVATLGAVEQTRLSLRPASVQMPGTASAATNLSQGFLSVWRQAAAGVLMLLGIGLAVKSGAMMMDGARKYG